MNRSTNRAWALRILVGAAVTGGLGLVALAGTASADPPPRHAPPPEAFTACDGKASGDACSVQLHDRTLDGTCGTFPGDTRLVCIPKDMPPPPDR